MTKEIFRLEYSDSQPGQWGPHYGDCWRAATPNKRYTRFETALRNMRERAEALTAPNFLDGVTRLVAIDEAGTKRVLAHLNNAAGLRCSPHRYPRGLAVIER